MKMLTQEAFQRTKAYIDTQGRPLDQARFAYHFEDGTVADVLSALAAYQNEDGGFGHGLEPDLRMAASSAIATQMAFDTMREVGANNSEPMVQRAVCYLLETLDQEQLRWEIVPPAVEDAPHAPWWTYGESAGSSDGFRSNPRAALIGFLHEYRALVPASLSYSALNEKQSLGQDKNSASHHNAILDQLIDAQCTHLLAQPVDDGVEMHALACYVTLVQSPNLADATRHKLTSALVERVSGTVITDPALFDTYGLLPLDVAPTPDAPLAQTVDQQAVDAHLDRLIDTQLEDGSWPLAWSWAFVNETAWAQAERDWKGKIAVSRLRTLAAYHRIAK